MTIKEYRESKPYAEIEEFSKKLYTWLSIYTDEVINYVFNNKLEEIINNEFTLNLIDELCKRESRESESGKFTFFDKVMYDGFEDIGIHGYSTSHSKSYRDVLYDMYISNIPRYNNK